MKWLVTFTGIIVCAEIYFFFAPSLDGGCGIVFLGASSLAALWAFGELVQTRGCRGDGRLRAERELVFAYECLILGSANMLAGPHVPSLVAAYGAAALGFGETLILWLVFKNPRIVRPVERPPSLKNLSARGIIVGLFYVGLGVTACAILVPLSTQARVGTIPLEFQWPGIALLYAAFGCLALGLAAEHSRSSAVLYVTVVLVAASSLGMEFVGRQNWYFLALSLFAFFCLVPGWPPAAARGPSEPSLNGAAEHSGG